jgi:hypothetical protein
MTDPLEGLRPPSRTLPVGGDVRAIASGRKAIHRRRATYGAVCGAGALAVGAVIAYDSGQPRDDSIGFLDPDETPSSVPSIASTTPLALPSQASALPTPSGLASIAPSGVNVPPHVGGSTEPSPDATESVSPSPAPTGAYVGPEPTTADGAAVMTRTASSDPTFCSAGAQQQVSVYSDGWCSALTGPSQVVAGRRVSYSYKLCRNVANGAGTLTFDTAKEVDFAVQHWVADYDHTEPVWQAGTTAELPPSPHTVNVDAGDCLTWTTTWSGQNNDGFAVPEGGGYEIDASGYANRWVGDDADFPPPVAFTAVSVSWE